MQCEACQNVIIFILYVRNVVMDVITLNFPKLYKPLVGIDFIAWRYFTPIHDFISEMNSIFLTFMESWILRVSGKVSEDLCRDYQRKRNSK